MGSLHQQTSSCSQACLRGRADREDLLCAIVGHEVQTTQRQPMAHHLVEHYFVVFSWALIYLPLP